MAITKKNMVNASVKRLQEVRKLLDSLQKEEKALKNEITSYMEDNDIESFKTSTCTIKFRHVPKLVLDLTLGLTEADLLDIAVKKGWTDCIKLQLDKKAYHERSKSMNNGQSVYLEGERLDLVFTYKD